MNENNAINVIEDLIETCKDGQKGYQDAAAHVKRSDLKTFFNEQSLERGQVCRGTAGRTNPVGQVGQKGFGLGFGGAASRLDRHQGQHGRG